MLAGSKPTVLSWLAPPRLVPLQHLTGPQQMALDVLLLEESMCAAEPVPALRFCQSKHPWISLGWNQRIWPQHWNHLVDQGRLDLVRRPSGGAAVLHVGGLTYGLIWPAGPQSRRKAYQVTCAALVRACQYNNMKLKTGSEPVNPLAPHCFASATAADLLDETGVKRIGNAQFWRRGKLLQHGELLLDPDRALWQDVFEEPAPKVDYSKIQVENLAEEIALELARVVDKDGRRAHDEPLTTAERYCVSKQAVLYDLRDECIEKAHAESSVRSVAVIESTTCDKARPNG